MKCIPWTLREFLWAKGYQDNQIEDLLEHMRSCTPLSKVQYDVMLENFKEYMVVGGMPAIVRRFIENKNFSGILEMQEQILLGLQRRHYKIC